MNLRVPLNAGKLSCGLTTGDLSSSAQFHRVSYDSVKRNLLTPSTKALFLLNAVAMATGLPYHIITELFDVYVAIARA
jgi:hypothetical protein